MTPANPWPFRPWMYVVALITLGTLLLLLTVSHAQAAGAPQACYDELLVRWNDFAADANNHIQTNDARRANHELAHDRLNREWEALHALACW